MQYRNVGGSRSQTLPTAEVLNIYESVTVCMINERSLLFVGGSSGLFGCGEYKQKSINVTVMNCNKKNITIGNK